MICKRFLSRGAWLVMLAVQAALVPSVESAPKPKPTVDVNDPVREPVQLGCLCVILDGSSGNQDDIQVPVGKRLVIEFVSVSAVLPTGQIPRVRILTETSRLPLGTTVFLQHDIALTVGPLARPAVSSDEYHGSQLVRLYADPETTVRIEVIRGDAVTGSATFVVRWTGYLVDIQ